MNKILNRRAGKDPGLYQMHLMVGIDKGYVLEAGVLSSKVSFMLS
jgi:hypothetical protein